MKEDSIPSETSCCRTARQFSRMIQEFPCAILHLTGGHSDSSAFTLHRLIFSRNFIKLISASTMPQAPRSRSHSASATGGAAEVRHCFWRFGSKRNAGRAPARSGLKWRRDVQRRIAQKRVPTARPSPLTSHLSPLTSTLSLTHQSLFAFPEYQPQEVGIGETTIVSALPYDDHVHGGHNEHSLIAGTNSSDHIPGCFTAKTRRPPALTFPGQIEHPFDVHLASIRRGAV